MENGIVTVEDLESVNGTFINGKRVGDVEVVHPGDHLSIGPVTFVVEYELSTTTLRQLSDEEDHEAKETESEIYVVEEADWQPEEEPPLLTAADVEVVEEPRPKKKKKEKQQPPRTEPLEVEQTDVETVPLAEEEDLHLSDSGTLRDFLVELDNADSHGGEHS
jgi:pSer/pThr/pTyr-binding forkhead associated (FHA) protein